MPGDNVRQTVTVGSRRSQLALTQTELAIRLLQSINPELTFNIEKISTVGDKILDVALSKIGDKSLFTKELETALLDKRVDFVVHSLKDVPTQLPHGLVLGCVFDRRTPHDVVLMSIGNRDRKLDDLPAGSVIGTSALRRVATLSRLYPHLRFVSIRGNLNTRLRKLDAHAGGVENGAVSISDGTQHYDAIVLAKAGIDRLGWSDRIDQLLDDSFYAVSQGALTCECRANDTFILSLLSKLHSEDAALTCIAERSLMRNLDGGCSTPIGVRTCLNSMSGAPCRLQLEANVLSLDGSQCVQASLQTELPCQADVDEGKCFHSPSENCPNANNNHCSGIGSGKIADDHCDLPEMEDQSLVGYSTGFMGILVKPICSLARQRMAAAQDLGKQLAEYLMERGAREILQQIRQPHMSGDHFV